MVGSHCGAMLPQPPAGRFHPAEQDFTCRRQISPRQRRDFTLPQEGLPHQSANAASFSSRRSHIGSHCVAMLPPCLPQEGISCPEGVFHAAARQYFMPTNGRYFILSPRPRPGFHPSAGRFASSVGFAASFSSRRSHFVSPCNAVFYTEWTVSV